MMQATNGNVTYTISNNDVEAPYIGYSGVTAFDVNTKITTSSGNKFNNTDTTKCIEEGSDRPAEATNLTAIRYSLSRPFSAYHGGGAIKEHKLELVFFDCPKMSKNFGRAQKTGRKNSL